MIEERALHSASLSVFAAPGAARMYRERYPDVPVARLAVVENGYDEESFARVESSDEGPLHPGTFTLVHSGIVYPSERDPTQLFRALRLLLDRGRLKPGELRLRLRASSHERLLVKLIDTFRVGDVVELSPPIAYLHALHAIMRAHGLLLPQPPTSNHQTPPTP